MSEWTDDELARELVSRFARVDPEPCRVCGRRLSMAMMGGGVIAWACDGLPIEGEEPAPGSRFLPGRRPADDHYSRSRVEIRTGDRRVLELLRRYAALRAESASGAQWARGFRDGQEAERTDLTLPDDEEHSDE